MLTPTLMEREEGGVEKKRRAMWYNDARSAAETKDA